MNKKSPNVIFKSKYSLALNCRDNKINSVNYKKNRLKDIEEMIDYFSNKKKKTVNMFEYYMGHTRGEKYNLILENGNYATKNDVKKIKEDYKKYIENSNLWKGILSFKREYIDEHIDIKTLEQKVAKEIIPQFLKYCGFKDIKNMSYVFSVHTNTKHPHIHFAFIEKKPNCLYCNNKTNYRRNGKITIDEQRYLKRLVELAIEREKYYTPLLKKTNEDIEELKSYFKPSEKNFILNNINEIYVEEDILKLGELLKKYRNQNNQISKNIKYNSIKNNEIGRIIKSLTTKIKKYLLNDPTSILYASRKNINEDLEKLNDYFNELNRNNNIEKLIINNSIVNKKEKYIDNYIFNSIVNHALYKYNKIYTKLKNKNNLDKITIDNLIQEIVCQNTNNDIQDDKSRRKRVLKDYFINDNLSLKFPNKYKLEKALRNINDEMEKSKDLFKNLFNYHNRD